MEMLYVTIQILHRGRGYGNNNNHALVHDKAFNHRPVLVIRWDAIHTPAPGTRMIGTQINKWKGEFLALCCTILDWLF